MGGQTAYIMYIATGYTNTNMEIEKYYGKYKPNVGDDNSQLLVLAMGFSSS